MGIRFAGLPSCSRAETRKDHSMIRTPRVNVLKLARAHAAVFIESKHFVAAMKAMGLLPRNWEPKRRPNDGSATDGKDSQESH